MKGSAPVGSPEGSGGTESAVGLEMIPGMIENVMLLANILAVRVEKGIQARAAGDTLHIPGGRNGFRPRLRFGDVFLVATMLGANNLPVHDGEVRYTEYGISQRIFQAGHLFWALILAVHPLSFISA